MSRKKWDESQDWVGTLAIIKNLISTTPEKRRVTNVQKQPE